LAAGCPEGPGLKEKGRRRTKARKNAYEEIEGYEPVPEGVGRRPWETKALSVSEASAVESRKNAPGMKDHRGPGQTRAEGGLKSE